MVSLDLQFRYTLRQYPVEDTQGRGRLERFVSTDLAAIQITPTQTADKLYKYYPHYLTCKNNRRTLVAQWTGP